MEITRFFPHAFPILGLNSKRGGTYLTFFFWMFFHPHPWEVRITQTDVKGEAVALQGAAFHGADDRLAVSALQSKQSHSTVTHKTQACHQCARNKRRCLIHITL